MSSSQQSGAVATVDRFGETETKQRAELAAIAVAAEARAQVEAGFIMAIKYPRNELQARAKILDTCKNLEFAQKAIYRKPIGGSYIEGASIRLAEEAARQWKNIKVQMATIYEDDDKKIVRVMVLDLESNISYDKAITIGKTVERKNGAGREIIGERLNSSGQRVFIVKATEDEMFTKESAQSSKAIRNGILRCIPEHILSAAKAQCYATMKAQADSDPQGLIRKICDSFAKYRVMPKNIEEYLGHSLDVVTGEEVTDLQAVYNTVKDGESTWAEIMEMRKAEDAEIKKEPEKANFTDALKPGDEKTHQAVDGGKTKKSDLEKEIGELIEVAYKNKKEGEDWLHAKFGSINVKDLTVEQLNKAKSSLLDKINS